MVKNAGTPKAAPKWKHSLTETSLPTKEPARSKVWKMICAADIAPQEVKWLWYPYIPAGRVTSIEGDPGIGKSWIAAAIASAVSGGNPLPGEGNPRAQNKVLMMSAEDGLADTMVPRLISLGADRHNIFFPDGRFILDPEGIRGLGETVKAYTAAILFIDPVQLFMGSKVDMNKANEVRGFMDGLHRIAEQSGAAIVIVRHMRKAGGGNALYRGLGSIDFTAAVRSVLQVFKGDDGRKYIQHEKCNNAPLGQTMTFKLEGSTFTWGKLVDRVEGKVSQTPRKLEEAVDFLNHCLANGPVLATALEEEANEAGISPKTLKRAKKGLVVSLKSKHGEWYWALAAFRGGLPGD